jgi:protein-S-isoprenylcysteine O-methyltransferase Ste14
MKQEPGSGKLVLKAIAGGLAFPLIILAVLLIAGNKAYWQGWVYGAANAALLIGNLFVLKVNPGLARERLQPGEGTKPWDKVHYALSAPLFLFTLVLAALDAGRFGWSPRLPLWLYIAAYAVYAAGQLFMFWAKLTNRFFSSVVRIQADRGHAVCDRGPYRIVRHPGYLGGLLYSLVTPLLLGSLWAFIPTALSMALLAVRTALEDRTLQAELPGYAQYAGKVRWRLLPAVW